MASKINSIQVLRGIAAMMVVIYHAEGMAPTSAPTILAHFGAAGVDIFFVISGFVMWITTAARHATPAQFLGNRIARIIPIYWAVTTLTFLVNVAVQHRAVPVIDLLLSALFVPHFSGETAWINPVVAVGWTLNFEMFFYALFAISLFASERLRLAILALVFLSMFAIGPMHRPAAGIYYASAMPLEFLAGCVIGAAYQRDIRLPVGLAIPLIMVAGSAILLSPVTAAQDFSFSRVAVWGIPSACVVLAAVAFSAGKSLFVTIGESSYSLYLLHSIVLVLLKSALIRTGFAIPSAVFVSVGVLASVSVGLVVSRWFEMPATRYLRVMFAGRATLSDEVSSRLLKHN